MFIVFTVTMEDKCQSVCVILCIAHQPINAPTAGAQAFLMDYTLGERSIPRGPSAGWWMLTTANAAETNDLTCLPKHGGARDNKFLVTHPMTDNVA
jgi:hypothetical protein